MDDITKKILDSFKDLRKANVFIYFGRNIVYEERFYLQVKAK